MARYSKYNIAQTSALIVASMTILLVGLSLAATTRRGHSNQYNGDYSGNNNVADEESRLMSSSRYQPRESDDEIQSRPEPTQEYEEDSGASNKRRFSSAASSNSGSDGPEVGTDESSAVDPEFNDLTGDSSDKMDQEMDGASSNSPDSDKDDADEADDSDGNDMSSAHEVASNVPKTMSKYQRAQSQLYHQQLQQQQQHQPQASGLVTDRLLGNPGNFKALDDEDDDSPISLDSNIANAKIRISPNDMAAAAGHHYGHKHYVHGWLKMGAHTGKKGSFGWHDKHPVGGKGRR